MNLRFVLYFQVFHSWSHTQPRTLPNNYPMSSAGNKECFSEMPSFRTCYSLQTSHFLSEKPLKMEDRLRFSARTKSIKGIEKSLLLENKILIRQYQVEADFHPFVKGVTFENVWTNRIRAKYGNTIVNFSSLDDMIRMKKAAGRTLDKEDLKYLLRIKKKIS